MHFASPSGTVAASTGAWELFVIAVLGFVLFYGMALSLGLLHGGKPSKVPRWFAPAFGIFGALGGVIAALVRDLPFIKELSDTAARNDPSINWARRDYNFLDAAHFIAGNYPAATFFFGVLLAFLLFQLRRLYRRTYAVIEIGLATLAFIVFARNHGAPGTLDATLTEWIAGFATPVYIMIRGFDNFVEGWKKAHPVLDRPQPETKVEPR